MLTVPVALGADSYDIHIRTGLVSEAGSHIPQPAGGRPLVIVTDKTVAAHHLDSLAAGIKGPVESIVLPAGESTKSWADLERLTEELLRLGVERGDHIVAFGGGVIGDLAGFAAGIVRRGCRFVQVPTTLLAQVDSSVGGKTAINSAAGKNLVGLFNQPSLVLIDPSLLATLPARELRAGYAEVIKYGLISDPEFYHWCAANRDGLLGADTDLLTNAIEVSCRAKARIVAEDERETSGRRALLNLGHTFGHAIEAELGYSGALLHGEAVGIGMRLALAYSARLGFCHSEAAIELEEHLLAASMPTRIPALAADPDALVRHMRQDKKASAGSVPLILARGIGQAFIFPDADLGDVREFLAADIEAT